MGRQKWIFVFRKTSVNSCDAYTCRFVVNFIFYYLRITYLSFNDIINITGTLTTVFASAEPKLQYIALWCNGAKFQNELVNIYIIDFYDRWDVSELKYQYFFCDLDFILKLLTQIAAYIFWKVPERSLEISAGISLIFHESYLKVSWKVNQRDNSKQTIGITIRVIKLWSNSNDG